MAACTKKYTYYQNIIFVFRYGQTCLIQFEDFGNRDAYRLLDRYKGKFCMFNDDIQGTAAVVVAGLLSAARITKKRLSEEKFVFLGAGGVISLSYNHGYVFQAATGIAEMIIKQMESEGLSTKDAYDRIYLVDIDGLITKTRRNLDPRHQSFAKDTPDTKDLLEVIKLVKPGALIGGTAFAIYFHIVLASTVGGAFTNEIIKYMAEINPRPIIFALSNPTSKAECTAEDAFKLTNVLFILSVRT